MPQLDVTTYSTQIFWLLVCFSVLLVLAKSFVVPNMDNIFNNRMRHINLLLDQASKLADEAKKIDREINDFIESSKIDIAQNEENAIRKLNVEIEKMQEELTNKNAENRDLAVRSIDESMKELKLSLEKEVPEMVNVAYDIMYSCEERK